MRLSRRAFFKVSAVGATLVLGIDANRARAAQGPFQPDTWVHILANNDTLVIVDKSEMGQGVMTALPVLIAEELDADWGRLRTAPAPVAPVYTNPALGSQATGGSTSVSSSYLPLRQAGAALRRLLLAAAATQTGIPVTRLRTRNSHVLLPNGAKLRYCDLTRTAARLPLPRHVLLKAPSRFRLIGRPLARLDTPSKTTGQARFGIDVVQPGMLIGAVCRPPTLGGQLHAYDDGPALRLAGVMRVVRMDQGVGVVARDTWTAWKALAAIRYTWAPGRDATASSTTLRARYRAAAAQKGAVAQRVGAPRALIAASRQPVRADYEIPYAAHAPLEPMNCTAHVHDGLCEIWVPTQAQTGVELTAARLTGLPRERIIVHTTLLGGAFGRRLDQDFVADAITLARTVAQPVKVIWSRRQDLMHDHYRPYSYHRVQGTLDRQGLPAAWQQTIVAPSLMRHMDPGAIKNGVDPTAVAGAVDMPYAIPHIEIDYVEADSPLPIGFWRSVSHSYTAFVKESFLDELAHAARRDPFLVRHALLAHDARQRRVLERVAQAVGWGRRRVLGQGIGFAVHQSFGTYMAQAAKVTMHGHRFTLERIVCACDCGTVVNPHIARAQIEGAVVFGLQAALKGPITWEADTIQQDNFDSYPLLRIDEMPKIDIYLLPGQGPPRGLGEPGVPPIAPALANAVFAASGVRHRILPMPLEFGS